MNNHVVILLCLNLLLFIASVIMSLMAEMDIGKTIPWYRDWYVWKDLSVVFGYGLLTIPTLLVLLV